MKIENGSQFLFNLRYGLILRFQIEVISSSQGWQAVMREKIYLKFLFCPLLTNAL